VLVTLQRIFKMTLGQLGCSSCLVIFFKNMISCLLANVLTGTFDFAHAHWEFVSEEAKDLVSKLLDR